MRSPPAFSLKHLLLLWLALCSLATAAAPGAGERLEMPMARFATGDDPGWARPEFDDSGWKTIKTSEYYESQGYDGYDGYSWYRIHVVIPSSLKAGNDWPRRLQVYLSAIDDADETYLNGVRIGKTGRMPGDPGGYESRWGAPRDYAVDLGRGIVRWDRDNVIAVRVYDNGGGGGFYKDKGVPHIRLAQRLEGLKLDRGQMQHRFLADDRVQITLALANRFPVRQRGELQAEFLDTASGAVVLRRAQALSIGPEGHAAVRWTLAAGPGMQARFRFVDASSGRAVTAVHGLPYRLTPPDAPTPAIHGARLLGARPGTPLHHRVPASGRAPLRYAAQGLPTGLTLDRVSGVISGTVPAAGQYQVQLRVSNALGTATREWTLVAGDQLALTPPMGWNSWTAYGLNVSDELMRSNAQALIDKGLAAKGWNTVNIDDGWEAARRRADGEIEGNARFPDMAALGRFLHERGLGFGIYSSPGATTCGGYLGTLGHEAQDAATYARWGVDYLKYDLCSYSQTMSRPPTLEEHQRPYGLMARALQAQPRGIVYSLCQYGEQKVWNWGASVGGHLWRMTGDIVDSWKSVLETGFAMAPYSALVRPGRWNDSDTLVVGQLGWGDALRPANLTPDEQVSHVSLWSLLAAPLLMGNDLSKMDDFTLGLLTNHEVIAINQDALGRAAERVLDRDGWQVWVKELEGGAKAVGVFNMGDTFGRMALAPALFGVGAAGQRYTARDAWRQRDLGEHSGALPVALPAHGVLLLTIPPGATTPATTTMSYANPFDRAVAGTFEAREKDWRNGAIVYQVLVDRFAPPADLQAKKALYPAPKVLRGWSELPQRGSYLDSAKVWSHEIDFWGGDLQSLAGKLDYVQQLGADVLYLNPIHLAYTNHKYDALDYQQVSPEFGTREDAKRLASDVHRRGMKLVFDGVFNHMGRNSPLFKQGEAAYKAEQAAAAGGRAAAKGSRYRDWFVFGPQFAGGARGWWNVENLPELNLENPEVRDHVYGGRDSVVRSWLRDGIDGWRLDVAFDIGFRFLDELTRAAHAEKPGSLVIGEIANYPREWYPSVDAVLHFTLRQIMLGTAAGRIEAPTAGRMINRMTEDAGIENMLKSWVYLDNHDTERLATALPDAGQRHIAQVLQFTLPGAPNLYYGGELDMAGGGDPEMRAPMRWDLVRDDHAPLAWTKKLIQMHRQHRALRVGNFRLAEATKLLAFERYTDRAADTVIVIVNPSAAAVSETVLLTNSKLMDGTRMIDMLGSHRGDPIRISSSLLRLSLPPQSFLVLKPDVAPPGGYSNYKRVQ